jgi:glycosyltransferase involved in cell wall biosynthesis
MTRFLIVVPCHNEEKRLDAERLAGLLARADTDLMFVDDGSTDRTRERLHEIAARAPDRVRVHGLPANRGKGEAVREGLLQALATGAAAVGYLDADLSTPPEEMLRLVAALEDPAIQVVLGSRVSLLGRRIERRRARHYLGRIFASVASIGLGIPVYDTQCGAKVFRRGPALEAALARPFSSRWAFDVELLGRLLVGEDGAPQLGVAAFLEVPLLRWQDVKGSSLSPGHMLKAGIDLLRISGQIRRRRARAPQLAGAGSRSGVPPVRS